MDVKDLGWNIAKIYKAKIILTLAKAAVIGYTSSGEEVFLKNLATIRHLKNACYNEN
jgi:hypothetical protein